MDFSSLVHLSDYTKVTIASDTKCSAELLKVLSTDRDSHVRRAVATNAKVTATALLNMMKSYPNDALMRFDIAKTCKYPTVLRALAKRCGRQVDFFLARNPKTPADVLAKLANKRDSFINVVALYLHENTPESVKEGLLKRINDSYRLAEELASDTNSISDLEMLAKHPDPAVRAEVAANSFTPYELLSTLARDESSVQLAVAKNKNTSAQAVVYLAKSPNEEVRALAAKHPNVSKKWVKILSTDSSPVVRKAVLEVVNQHRYSNQGWRRYYSGI